ncbi:hypothetical protein GCM10009785_13870 [Brooklawnia cerclae]|uniref:Phage-type endonuclease n=1 Tax=Brooklawnia cerclae TaxID=349934 RepID=A0ABX0SI75_9ACTN|nr:YqaJ viral recombinase family protein [Brooklawnia cerclae]NIH58044.1 putative phage-type endonuclease [Brooklawnia cerclae]
MDGPERIESHTPGSPQWHSQRTARLGGSEIAAVLGLSPFESRFSLWHRKAGIIDAAEDSPEMEWGRRLEDAIRQRWAEDHHTSRMVTGATYLLDGWKIASPDGLAYRDGSDTPALVEVKHPMRGDEWGETGSDQVPVYYLTQARWYMHVLGLPACHFAVLIGACDYREYTVFQDEEDVALMVREGRAFLDSIAEGRRPVIDGSDETYQAVRQLHPDIDGSRIEIPPSIGRDLLAADANAKRADAERRRLISTVLDLMGKAKHADIDGTRIAYRTARATKDGEPGTPFLLLDRKATLTHHGDAA